MKITIRSDSIYIEGYVNAVGRDSRKLHDDYGYAYKEQIQPGTFARALKVKQDEKAEILMLLDHDEHRVLGGTNTNLELEEDSIGLFARATVTDPEVIEKARAHKLQGWSFGFRILDYKDEYSSDCRRQIITEMELVEVTLVDDRAIPAYSGTSVHTRTDGTEQEIKTRTMDGSIFTENEAAAAEPVHEPQKPEPLKRTEPEPPVTVDNSKFYNIINKFKEKKV